MDPITKQILDFIRAYRNEHGVGPSLEEISEHVGMSKPGIQHRILLMEKAGLVKRGRQRRSLDVVQ